MKYFILFLIALSLGFYSAQRNIITYHVGNYTVAVHNDWLTYGLPIAEYIAIYKTMDTDVERAKSLIISLLHLLKNDAEERLHVVRREDRERISLLITQAEQILKESESRE